MRIILCILLYDTACVPVKITYSILQSNPWWSLCCCKHCFSTCIENGTMTCVIALSIYWPKLFPDLTLSTRHLPKTCEQGVHGLVLMPVALRMHDCDTAFTVSSRLFAMGHTRAPHPDFVRSLITGLDSLLECGTAITCPHHSGTHPPCTCNPSITLYLLQLCTVQFRIWCHGGLILDVINTL